MVLQELKDPIMHVLRNCVSHGIERPDERRDKGKSETGTVTLSLEVAGGRLKVAVEDDGQGIDLAHVQQQAVRRGLLSEAAAAQSSTREILSTLFEPGFSTLDVATELAGRGMGLSVVRDAVMQLQGEVTLLPRPEGGVRVHLSVPTFVSTHRVLLVACGNQTIAIPTRGIERLLRFARDKVETIEGQPIVMYQRRPVRLVRFSDVLGQSDSADGPDQTGGAIDCVVEIRDAITGGFGGRSDGRAGRFGFESGRVCRSRPMGGGNFTGRRSSGISRAAARDRRRCAAPSGELRGCAADAAGRPRG